MLSLILSGGTGLSGQSFSLFAVNDLLRVFEDGYKLPPAHDTVSLFGIRAETISGQFVIDTKSKLTDVSVDIGPLTNTITGSTVPATAIRWDFVGSVLLPTNAPNQPLSAVVRPAPAMFPDYLMAERKIDIQGKSYQAVWLTLDIPDNAEAGNYSGTVTAKSAEGERSLPLSLTVYPLTLPPERHLKIAVRYSVDHFEKYHGITEKYSDEWYDMLKVYADNMAAHRQNVMQASLRTIEISLSPDGKLEFDFTQFDRIVQVFMNTGGIDYIETGYGLTRFGEGAWFSTEIELSDFKVLNRENGETITMAGRDVVPVFLPAFESHL